MNELDKARYAAWQCKTCKQYKAIPILARDCEERHRLELEQCGAESP